MFTVSERFDAGGEHAVATAAVHGAKRAKTRMHSRPPLAIIRHMKLKLDAILIVGMALCYALGHLFLEYRFSQLASILLLVFILRLLSSSIRWLLGGR